MRKYPPIVNKPEFQKLLELTERAGSDPLLTQGSTGNSSIKLDGILWIKASGRWMADALRDDILIPLDLAGVVNECLRQGGDPAECYPGASLETAMHATLPHRVALHVHCVNTIAWAVRKDAPAQLHDKLEGLRWRWIPYVASGLPLSRAIEATLAICPDTNVFVLGNHGLVIGGDSAEEVGRLLGEVRRRLVVAPRQAHPADYAALLDLSNDSPWDLPDDDCVHGLATDPVSQAILAKGLLYPCQAIFSGSDSCDLFRVVPCPDSGDWRHQYRERPFLMIEGRGVLVRRSIGTAELAMISGLAQVIQRVNAAAPLRYLTSAEIAGVSGQVAYHYRELASAHQRA